MLGGLKSCQSYIHVQYQMTQITPSCYLILMISMSIMLPLMFCNLHRLYFFQDFERSCALSNFIFVVILWGNNLLVIYFLSFFVLWLINSWKMETVPKNICLFKLMQICEYCSILLQALENYLFHTIHSHELECKVYPSNSDIMQYIINIIISKELQFMVIAQFC